MPDAHGDPALIRRVLHGVFQQVDEDLDQAFFVPLQHHILVRKRQLDRMVLLVR